MKVFVVLAATFAVGLSAPANTVYGVKRSKKSAYGAPCAGGGPLAPIALYLAPQQQQPQGPHYRENESLDNDNHEHPSARSYYDAGPGPAGIASAGAGPAAHSSAPAVGIFPHANLGGCATPLLLSCAPNVVSGHIVKHTGYAHPAPGPAYREVEMNNNMEMEMKEAAMDKARAEAERSTSHHHENFNSAAAQGHHHHEAMQHAMAHHSASHQASSHQGTSLQHNHNLGHSNHMN